MFSVFPKSAKRPVIVLSWSGADRTIEVAALLALIATFALLAAYWPHLPDRVPVKFALNGEIKSWGDRSLMLLVPLTALATYVGLTVLGRFPHLFNYPIAITPENAERHYRLGRWMLAAIKLAVLLLLATITLAILHSATAPGAAGAIGAVIIIPIVLFIAFVLALVIVTIIAHRRIERQPESWSTSR